MRYAIWISTPSAEEAQAIATQETAVVSEEFDFAIRELETDGSPTRTDLAFHVDFDSGAEDAKARALEAYALCRAEDGLGDHADPTTRVAVRSQEE